jgi:DNA-binding winged-HTH domains
MRTLDVHRYSFGEFTLDLTRGCLTERGVELRLRPKSFAVLRYLVENHGRLISKEELIEAVWPDTAVTDNSLVQCLKEVREVLGDKSQNYIKTVPRRGYIFADLDRTPKAHSVRSLLIAPTVYVFNQPASSRPQKIAVLPFKPLSGDENDTYLGLGIADTLITRLGSTEEIFVRPTSAIQKYASLHYDSIAAGREQQVDAVLEGSIQRSGEKLRVTVRLLSVKDGSTLWAFKSDENFRDIFAVEDSISEKLANALALNLTSQSRQTLAKHYTHNQEAYQLYSKGVFLRNQMTSESLEKSVSCFRKAIEWDPNYALAYAGQASSISPMAGLGFISWAEAESRNRPLIAKALELDDTLPEAHAAVAEFKLFIEWDFNSAEMEFRRALELNPKEPLSHLLYPDLLLLKGRAKEAVAMSKSAYDMDPFSARTGKALAHVYYYARKYDEALDQSKRTLELHPGYHLIFFGPIYEGKGMYDAAVDGYLQTEEQWGLAVESVAALRQAYATTGWRGYWQKRLELLRMAAKQRSVSPLRFAQLYARVGDKDKAFEWLERAHREHDASLILIKIDPIWDDLRSEPRFANLLHRIGLS